MKILNIHGYGGSAENSAFKAFKDCGFTDIIAPALDYDKLPPEQMLDYLSNIAKNENAELICGTSLGGFYAALLSAELDMPVILVNPCLIPFLHLPRLGYNGDIKPFVKLFGKLSSLHSDNVSCIIGEKDSIIDTHDFTENFLTNPRFRKIPDGDHFGYTLPLKEYFSEILSSY